MPRHSCKDGQQQSKSQQPLNSSTIGKLGSADAVLLPSTLSYRERTWLSKKAAFEYSQIYTRASSRGMGVHDRLMADAAVRQTLRALHTPPELPRDSLDSMMAASAAAGAGSSSSNTSCDRKAAGSRPASGFVNNNGMPTLMRKLHESASSVHSCSNSGSGGGGGAQAAPLASLHPITYKSYYKHHQLDFMAAARPAARTTNQTLRMLGTYAADTPVAQALGVFVPGGVAPGFHPDVKDC